ncbi:HD domain-containing protein [Allorhizocola rhizosphaerae]|uniref:HD domain-containing protein n=1 Tax=Allorhizocola rhizosphaerae TaxID=1872709 RepID=UPI000E3C2D99|nr:HD domain-containing protein [Allorhizocola rhizosphaerae]
MEHVAWARDLARQLLAEALPTRWAHTQGVARAAESIADIVDEDAETLICAAWLHDIGYAPGLAQTGFHPLDGARYLRDKQRADERLCRLVAHHSCAVIEAGKRSLAAELVAEFPPVGGLVAEALTYCDMTTSPRGEPVDVQQRLREILGRYGKGSIVAESIAQARTEIERSARLVSAAVAQRR